MIYNVERGALKLDFIQFDCKAEAYLEGFECNTFSKSSRLLKPSLEKKKVSTMRRTEVVKVFYRL